MKTLFLKLHGPVVAVALGIFSCTQDAQPLPTGSGLSNVVIGVPQDKLDLFTGYHIKIERWGASKSNADCTALVEDSDSTQKLTIQKDLKSDCEYLIVLEFGDYFAGPPKQLRSVKYSNTAKGGNGTVIPASKMTSGDVSLPITVYKSQANTDPSAPDEVTTPGETDLEIDVNFGDGQNNTEEQQPTEGQQQAPDNGRAPPPPETQDPQPEVSTPPAGTENRGQQEPPAGREDNVPEGTLDPNPSAKGAELYAQVKQALMDKCGKCHGQGGSADSLFLTTYPLQSVYLSSEEAVIDQIIIMTEGNIPDMPPTGSGTPLTEEERNVFKQWKATFN